MARGRDAYYLVVSSSAWGNLRDLVFLLAMGREARNRLTVHLHGANWDVMMARSSALRRWANRTLMGDVHRAIVLGRTFEGMFKGYVQQGRVVAVHNYYEDHLLIPERRLKEKWKSREPMRILYLSNLIPEKGYLLLLRAFLRLRRTNLLPGVELHFAGAFHSGRLERAFRKLASGDSVIKYHGVVHGFKKRILLWRAHVFCLPTVYRFEGQPISILEAYAAGCAVLTTNNGGIKDIFKEPMNGLYVGGQGTISETSVARGIMKALHGRTWLARVARRNRAEAMMRYRRDRFCANVEACLVTQRGASCQ
jgi:glycosyltransferase involved in cell wall biosynthesis